MSKSDQSRPTPLGDEPITPAEVRLQMAIVRCKSIPEVDAVLAMYRAERQYVAQSETVAMKGWAIQHADRKRWRTMDTIGMPDWTDDLAKALVCRLKDHIERYAEDDEDDIRIVEVAW
jgi:hypothetical protein